MPLISYVRFTTQTSATAEIENRRAEEGITYRGVLEEELSVNPSKFTVLVNGSEVSDLDLEVSDGDAILLQPLKYSSGISVI